MGDGAIKFITDSIEAGTDGDPSNVFIDNPAHPLGSPGPYGLFGALGTRANKEVIDGDF